MKKINIIKTIISMLALAVLPVKFSAYAEDVKYVETYPAVIEEAATTSSISSSTATITTTKTTRRIAAENIILNATEAEMRQDKTYQIEASVYPNNSTDRVAFRYISDDETIATVDGKGTVTAHNKGQTTITVIADSMKSVVKDNETEVYTVLVLDNSGSMKGEPLAALKEAAVRLCSDVLSSNTRQHKFSVVVFGSEIQVASDFTDDLTELTDIINGIELGSSTNYTLAFDKAYDILYSIRKGNVIKNIVFCSDGLPSVGKTSSDGPFMSSDGSDYKRANGAVAAANELKDEGYRIYTFGFFHNLTQNEQFLAVRLMRSMASKNNMSYTITDSKKLSGVFSEAASGIINYDRVASYKKTVDIKVLASEDEESVTPEITTAVEVSTTTTTILTSHTTQTVQTSEPSQTSGYNASVQDSPKTNDNNYNTILVTIILLGIISAAVAFRAEKIE